MSAYFRKLDDKPLPTWAATSSAGSFIAAVVKRDREWLVETGKTGEGQVHFRTPSLESAFDFVSDHLSGIVKVK